MLSDKNFLNTALKYEKTLKEIKK